MTVSRRLRVLLATLALGATQANAGAYTSLSEVTRHTVTTNPEIQAAMHAFDAATQEQRVAKGGYMPRLDVEAGIGREYIDDPRFPDNDFTRDQVSVSLNQMLFDGFATRNEVRRLGHAARTRFYEVWAAAEETAGEASRAYFDVLRHRELVRMSKENYATHRLVYEQIERRVSAGFSRRVDLDQAAGRLALAESNLLTDITNLHDVSMRYQRIVGELPAENLQEPEIPENILPESTSATLDRAFSDSPLMSAALANVWSAEAQAELAKAPMMPRFDVRARQEIWHDKDDINGRYEEGVIELVGSYNLYNGGSDTARRRQRLEELNVAKDLRDKTCRDVRQQVTIAYNNTQRLKEQLIYLDRHQLAIEKAREAYRNQFEIGQRTLLDVLDSENEFYEARRAYINGQRDHLISYAGTLAGMGALLQALEVGHELLPMEPPKKQNGLEPDPADLCPSEFEVPLRVDKDAIFKEALEKQGLAPAAAGSDAALPSYFKGGGGN